MPRNPVLPAMAKLVASCAVALPSGDWNAFWKASMRPTLTRLSSNKVRLHESAWRDDQSYSVAGQVIVCSMESARRNQLVARALSASVGN
jgi:hypothetical protein